MSIAFLRFQDNAGEEADKECRKYSNEIQHI